MSFLSVLQSIPAISKSCLGNSGKHKLVCLAVAQLFLVSGIAHAKPRFDDENVDFTPFEEEFDDAQKPWQEVAVHIPPQPAPANLIPFDILNATAGYSFALDSKSLTVGSDGVIRYIVVATSPAGAKNISYEGIRCSTFERKLYAFGRPDGTWSRSRRDQWERIPRRFGVNYHASLAMEYFCQNLTVAGKPEDMLSRIRYNRPLNSGEQPGD